MTDPKDMLTSHGMAKAGLRAGQEMAVASLRRGLEEARIQAATAERDTYWRARCRALIVRACDEMWTTYGSGSINYPADFEAIADRLLAEPQP